MSASTANKSLDQSLEKQCLNAANRLITKCNANVPSIRSISDIDSTLIVLLFEKITNVQIPDLLSCTHKVEEAHNVQAVIDTLSLDLLGISLSHITGETIVAGNLVAIRNLLEVLEGVLTCATSSTYDQKNKKINLKRKISERRKCQRQLFVEKEKSNETDSSAKKQDKIHEPSNRHPLDDLLEELQKKQPRRLSSRIKENGLRGKGGKNVPSENLSDSAIKSPPSKLRKHSDKEMARGEIKQPSDAVDHKVVSNKPQRRSQRHLKYKDIPSDTKQHFQVGPDHIKKKPIAKEKRNYKKPIKTKTSKAVSVIKTKEPISVEKTEEPFKSEKNVEELYEKNLERKIRVIVEKNSYLTSRASHLKKWHLQGVKKLARRTPISVCRKSFLLPHTLRHRSVPQTVLKRITTNKVQPLVNVQKQIGNNLPATSKSGFIQELFEDFPALDLPSSVMNRITKKYQEHLLNMHTKAKDCLLKLPKIQTRVNEAAVKQSAISNLLKKDVKQQQYMKEFKANKENENKMKYYLRDARMQTAKMKHYSNEFQIEMRKKMQKRNFTEELIFEKVFEDALKIQKEQVDHLCKEVKETGENDARKHLIYLDALENLYQTQFTMMSETLATEKQDIQLRVKAEKQVMDTMQREFREELKNEIRFMQQAIIECTEDTHFRELDAEQYKERLRKKLS